MYVMKHTKWHTFNRNIKESKIKWLITNWTNRISSNEQIFFVQVEVEGQVKVQVQVQAQAQAHSQAQAKAQVQVQVQFLEGVLFSVLYEKYLYIRWCSICPIGD